MWTFEALGSFAILTSWLLLLGLCGCAVEEPWRDTLSYADRILPPPQYAPEIRHCNDTVGHTRGTYPYIFGGTCCCNPSMELLDAYHRDGFLGEWGADALLWAYRSRNIATTKDHHDCNNICEYGPHLVRGGRCMVPPTPGTLNYEQVLTGRYALSPWEAQRVAEQGGPFLPEPWNLEGSPDSVEPFPAASAPGPTGNP
ncbi:MAG: hypothetical protein V3T77_06965 [Planctomycetota bacterium]